ncbi:uncharacterized protein LOC115070507 [Nannospalax galili]|uniref:uncharacterized protein LOC115070507 n=1 Tax=Nannospalax galili TaxID=1026970 RepID=UPI00111C09A4|nr:uncharacterized protein LOC115070507 [Nannospalax galili]
MLDLYWIICNEKPRSEPLFSPYGEALHRILGYSHGISYFPDPLTYGAAAPMYPQPPPGYFPTPVNSVVQDPQEFQWQPCNMNPPYPLPAMVPEDSSPEKLCSTSYDQLDPQ